MAIQARKTSEEILYALVEAHNSSRREATFLGTSFHADKTAQSRTGDYKSPVAVDAAVAAADASDLATLLTLCADLGRVYALHLADSRGHKVADVANAVAAPVPDDLATAQTFLNEMKADYNLHRASTTYHYTADATNAVASADGSDQATSETLANEIKTDLNAHIQGAPDGHSIELVDA